MNTQIPQRGHHVRRIALVSLGLFTLAMAAASGVLPLHGKKCFADAQPQPALPARQSADRGRFRLDQWRADLHTLGAAVRYLLEPEFDPGATEPMTLESVPDAGRPTSTNFIMTREIIDE
jgi:hypothetical protein